MAAEAVQYNQMTKQIYFALQWMTQEIIQFRFTTLSNFSVSISQNPTSADLIEVCDHNRSISRPMLANVSFVRLKSRFNLLSLLITTEGRRLRGFARFASKVAVSHKSSDKTPSSRRSSLLNMTSSQSHSSNST